MKPLLRGVWILVAGLGCAAVFGVGVPMFFVWLGAQFQDTSGPNSGVGMLTAAIVILGPLATYITLLTVVGRFRFTQDPDARHEPERMVWMRSRDEIRQKNRHTSTFEQIVFIAIFISFFGFEVWFFFLAKCPSTQCFG